MDDKELEACWIAICVALAIPPVPIEVIGGEWYSDGHAIGDDEHGFWDSAQQRKVPELLNRALRR